jgi:hypothetical protein
MACKASVKLAAAETFSSTFSTGWLVVVVGVVEVAAVEAGTVVVVVVVVVTVVVPEQPAVTVPE